MHPYQSQQVVVMQPQSNGLGTAGFVVSLLGFFTCGLISPLGLLLSFGGLAKAPRGLALAGVVLGGIGSWWLIAGGFAIIAGTIGIMNMEPPPPPAVEAPQEPLTDLPPEEITQSPPQP